MKTNSLNLHCPFLYVFVGGALLALCCNGFANKLVLKFATVPCSACSERLLRGELKWYGSNVQSARPRTDPNAATALETHLLYDSMRYAKPLVTSPHLYRDYSKSTKPLV